MSNIWNNRLPRIIAPYWWGENNIHPRLFLFEEIWCLCVTQSAILASAFVQHKRGSQLYVRVNTDMSPLIFIYIWSLTTMQGSI